uniref:Heat shock 70 kDa protein 14-like n=2 Tax=Nicotiana TaxID=4085 RepID=A0A1S3Y760_TOBAC|nr:PREDICTED: heat shock 70 kDa protein 14-like [Nicotiana tabacum]
MERGSMIDQFVYCINSYREAAMSNDPKFDHIDLAEKKKVLNECVETEAWFREKKQQQDALPKYANPVLLSADVRKKAEALDRVCRPIMTKPKPVKPATPETPSSQPPQGGEQQPPPGGEQQPQGAESPNSGNANTAEGASAGSAVPPAAEPMDTDKSETVPSAS